jgi:hypothetical protein
VQCILACPSPDGEPLHGAVPTTPSRDQVVLAMQQIHGAVMVCGAALSQGPSTARVHVTFASAGGVADALVSAPWGGTLPGTCIERAVRRAHVPRFTRDTFTVDYPFTVR